MIKVTKRGKKAWVTFSFKPEHDINGVELLCECNDWKPESMKKKKNGEYYITKIVAIPSVYQFGYKIDGKWQTDDSCKLVASPFNSNNSLLEI